MNADNKVLDAYACLLRRAWLNPTDRWSWMAVRAFERKYDRVLDENYKRWRGRDVVAEEGLDRDPCMSGLMRTW